MLSTNFQGELKSREKHICCVHNVSGTEEVLAGAGTFHLYKESMRQGVLFPF